MHDLKTWPEFYSQVVEPDITKRKTVEIRKNDRNFKVGDELILFEYNPIEQTYTGRQTTVLVTNILDQQPWLPEGYVAMSILLLSELSKERFIKHHFLNAMPPLLKVARLIIGDEQKPLSNDGDDEGGQS